MKRAITKFKRRFNTRAWSNDELLRMAPWFTSARRVINVSGWLDKDKDGGAYKQYFPTAQTYHVSNYAADRAKSSYESDLFIDLSSALPEELHGRYDIAFNHTVLEHMLDPGFSFRQIATLTQDLIITVVPWKQKFHFSPGNFGDYFRMSPFVMRRWHEEAGFTLLWESFTPLPSLDTYLFYVGTRRPEAYAHLPRHVPDINSLQGVIGVVSGRAIVQNLAHLLLLRLIKLVNR